MIKIIKNYFRKIYIQSDPEMYDREHLGTFSFLRLFLINIFSPGRTINRLRYNQIWKNKNHFEYLTEANFKNLANFKNSQNFIWLWDISVFSNFTSSYTNTITNS